MTDILMPALSPTMEEGKLAKWHVKVGDTVSSGDVIAEIETDKATMEVEAVDEGKVTEILVPEGTEGVKVNAPIARLDGDDSDDAGASAPPPAKAPEPKPAEAAKPDAAPAQTGGKPGGGHASPEAALTPQGVQPVAQAAPPAQGQAAQPAKAAASGRVFASPLARRIAQQNGVNLSSIQGSGPHGRIVARDVEGKASQATGARAASQAAQAAPAAEPRQVLSLEQMGIKPGSYDLIPLDGMRRTIAKRMTESFRDVPHFPLTIDCEIDRLLEARARLNSALTKQGVKVSVNDFVIKASAVALKQVPAANASYTPDGIAIHHNADVAMAVAIEGGLITPIIFAAETKGLAQISREAKDLATRARERKLKPEEYQGGTFSVSNLGMFGIKDFASIINEPQGAIMSVGAGEPRAVVKEGQLAIATVMSVTLTCDHRVVDGATGAKFLQAFKILIEDPVVMLA